MPGDPFNMPPLSLDTSLLIKIEHYFLSVRFER